MISRNVSAAEGQGSLWWPDSLIAKEAAGMRLPRLLRRGLIEATSATESVPSSLTYFRGFFAAASLKQKDANMVDEILPYFRGFFAAASLKRMSLTGSTAGRITLPRLLRRGLIEANKLRSAGIKYDALPRLLRRGLIEAAGRRWCGRPCHRNFRGFFAAASLKHQNMPIQPSRLP